MGIVNWEDDMTIAVCVFCGEIKTGSYTACEICKRAPLSEDDLIYATALSDHFLTPESLREISHSMISGMPRPPIPSGSKETLREYARQWMKNPVYKMIAAKYGVADTGPSVKSRPSSGVASWITSFFSGSRAQNRATPKAEAQAGDAKMITIEKATKFMEDAESCLNDKDGPEFVAGIRIAYMPLHDAATKAVQRDLGYGDVLRQYAQMHRSHPEQAIAALLDLASRLKPPPAFGVRFVAGQLMLEYIGQGAVRYQQPMIKTMTEQIACSERALRILRTSQRWSEEQISPSDETVAEDAITDEAMNIFRNFSSSMDKVKILRDDELITFSIAIFMIIDSFEERFGGYDEFSDLTIETKQNEINNFNDLEALALSNPTPKSNAITLAHYIYRVLLSALMANELGLVEYIMDDLKPYIQKGAEMAANHKSDR